MKAFGKKAAGRLLGIPSHRISYALDMGYVAPPSERLEGQHIFREEDVARLRKYFALQDARKRIRHERKGGRQS